MMLINLNIIIAILMDGYAGVKEAANSKVEQHVKHNVGSLLYVMLEPIRRRYQRCLSAKVARQHANDRIIINPDPLTVVPWADDRWIECLHLVVERRRSRGVQSSVCTIGGLMNHVRVVMIEKYQISETQVRAVPWLIKRHFQMRDYMPPPDICDPFHEPSDEGRLLDIQKNVKKLCDKQLPLIAAQLTTMQVSVMGGGSNLSEESRTHAMQLAPRGSSFDNHGSPVKNLNSESTHSPTLVESMQRTIEEQHKTIAGQQRVIAELQASVASEIGSAQVDIREVEAFAHTPRPQESDEEHKAREQRTKSSILDWMKQQEEQKEALQSTLSGREESSKFGLSGLSERLGLKKTVTTASILTKDSSRTEAPKGMPPT